jgi:hypothetical protein
MSSENELEVPKFNRGRRGSVDDTIKDFLNPKLEFHQEQLPKGSNALQILIHQCEDEKKHEDSGSDSDKSFIVSSTLPLLPRLNFGTSSSFSLDIVNNQELI